MALKKYKPTTPGQRGLVLIDRADLYKGRPEKTLTQGLTKKGGRNNTGRITARRIGGGSKKLYRIVDFKRRKWDMPATVEADHSNQNFGKAGRTRWKGKRPSVRGVAMNPIDHPHGGGEGRTSGGRNPVTPWGKPTKGPRTRNNKTTDKLIIRSRHARKKK